jgi:hypothetical protein
MHGFFEFMHRHFAFTGRATRSPAASCLSVVRICFPLRTHTPTRALVCASSAARRGKPADVPAGVLQHRAAAVLVEQRLRAVSLCVRVVARRGSCCATSKDMEPATHPTPTHTHFNTHTTVTVQPKSLRRTPYARLSASRPLNLQPHHNQNISHTATSPSLLAFCTRHPCSHTYHSFALLSLKLPSSTIDSSCGHFAVRTRCTRTAPLPHVTLSQLRTLRDTSRAHIAAHTHTCTLMGAAEFSHTHIWPVPSQPFIYLYYNILHIRLPTWCTFLFFTNVCFTLAHLPLPLFSLHSP